MSKEPESKCITNKIGGVNDYTIKLKDKDQNFLKVSDRKLWSM